MRLLIELALRRPKAAIAFWMVIFLAAAPFAARLAGELRGSTDAVPGSASEKVARDLARDFGEGSAFVFPAVISNPALSALDPRFRAAADLLTRRLKDAGVNNVRTFWNTGDQRLLGKDGHSGLALITPRASTFFEAESMVTELRAAVADSHLGPAFEVKITGMISLFHDLDRDASADLLAAEKIGIPLTLLVLLVVFAAPVAAALPLVLAAGTTVVTLALLFAMSRFMPVSLFAQNAVTMVGLGIGVDYALFLVSRCREELQKGETVPVAVRTAALSSGHVVLVSGLAVGTGFLALFLVNIPFMHTLALAGLGVVVTAILLTLTLLPALLLLVGHRLNWPNRKLQKSTLTPTLWARWANETIIRPWRYLVPALVILAIFIIPTLRIKSWNMGARDLSPAMEARQGFDMLERNFSAGWMGPIAVLIQTSDGGTVWTPAKIKAIARLQDKFERDQRVAIAGGAGQIMSQLDRIGAEVSKGSELPLMLQSEAAQLVSADGHSALTFLVPHSAPESREVMNFVRELRRSTPKDLAAAGLTTRIGGFSASIMDFDEEMFRSLKVVVPVVLGLTFVFLVFAFRSIVVPLKAIAMNLIAVFCAYGFLVYLFQDGIGASAIGLIPPGGLNSFIVLMLFTILFGLSMDYEVFLLSRIRDEYKRTGDNRGSVVSGLSQTGGLITSAALIMVVLFGSFGFTKSTATREFGLGLAFAVALDATLIRVVLVPVLMGLFGRANWWLPQWAGRRSHNVVTSTVTALP